MTDEQTLNRIEHLLDIIHTQSERMDVLSERISTANKRIDQLIKLIS